MNRIGDQQLRLLQLLGAPDRALIVQDRIARSLVTRGLLREEAPGGAVGITGAGLRALADCFDAGRIESGLDRLRGDAKKNEARFA